MLSSDNLIPGGDYKPLQGEKNLDDLVNDLFLPANGLFLQWEKGRRKTTVQPISP